MSWINRQELLMKASMGPRHQTQVDLGNLGKIRFLEAYMNPGDELLAPEKLGRRIDDGLVESIWFELLRLEGDATRTEAFESTMDTIEKGITAHPALFAFKMSLWEEKEGEVPPPSAEVSRTGQTARQAWRNPLRRRGLPNCPCSARSLQEASTLGDRLG